MYIFKRLRVRLAPRCQTGKLNPQCSEFEVDNWAISQFILDKLIPAVGIHPFPLNELHLMVSAICYIKPAIIFEWGTNVGKSARVFYETSRYFNIPMEIHSIDLPDNISHPEHPNKDRGKLVKGFKNVFLHQGDGLLKTLEVSRRMNSEPTFVFIDGDHSYESVYKELTNIMKHIPHASILLHDTFYQSQESKYNVGPHIAIQDALKQSEAEYLIQSTKTGLPGMTFLYKDQYI